MQASTQSPASVFTTASRNGVRPKHAEELDLDVVRPASVIFCAVPAIRIVAARSRHSALRCAQVLSQPKSQRQSAATNVVTRRGAARRGCCEITLAKYRLAARRRAPRLLDAPGRLDRDLRAIQERIIYPEDKGIGDLVLRRGRDGRRGGEIITSSTKTLRLDSAVAVRGRPPRTSTISNLSRNGAFVGRIWYNGPRPLGVAVLGRAQREGKKVRVCASVTKEGDEIRGLGRPRGFRRVYRV